MPLRTIKGKTTVKSNTKEDIWQTARFLLTEMFSRNKIRREDFRSIIFSCTKDLTAARPSEGVETCLSLQKIPFLC